MLGLIGSILGKGKFIVSVSDSLESKATEKKSRIRKRTNKTELDPGGPNEIDSKDPDPELGQEPAHLTHLNHREVRR